MIKNLLLIPILLLLVACTESSFKENAGVTKYALDTYGEKLLKEKVKYLKCYRGENDEMKVVFTTANRDNSFPATIRFDYLNASYNVYFDEAYLNGSRDTLIKDIDTCVAACEQLKDAQQTWK